VERRLSYRPETSKCSIGDCSPPTTLSLRFRSARCFHKMLAARTRAGQKVVPDQRSTLLRGNDGIQRQSCRSASTSWSYPTACGSRRHIFWWYYDYTPRHEVSSLNRAYPVMPMKLHAFLCRTYAEDRIRRQAYYIYPSVPMEQGAFKRNPSPTYRH